MCMQWDSRNCTLPDLLITKASNTHTGNLKDQWQIRWNDPWPPYYLKNKFKERNILPSPQHNILLLHPSLKHNITTDWGQNMEAVLKGTLSVTFNELGNESRGPLMKLVNEHRETSLNAKKYQLSKRLKLTNLLRMLYPEKCQTNLLQWHHQKMMLPSLKLGFPVQHQTLFFVEWEAEELQLLV